LTPNSRIDAALRSAIHFWIATAYAIMLPVGIVLVLTTGQPKTVIGEAAKTQARPAHHSDMRMRLRALTDGCCAARGRYDARGTEPQAVTTHPNERAPASYTLM
jgi:hypothetical protein